MIFLDAMAMKFRNVKLRNKNPNCVACGTKSIDPATFNYNEFCLSNCALPV